MRTTVALDPGPEEPARDAEADERLVVDLGAWEGPLDLLLDLARRQKVDLAEISILALADQYLLFVAAMRGRRLELAADYLTMAAWLAFLKSRLLLPAPAEPEGPSAADLATALAERLRRLDLMRRAARLLDERPQLGRDVFASSLPDEAAPPVARQPEASLHDILAGYARVRRRAAVHVVAVGGRQVVSLADARDAVEAALGRHGGWTTLEGCVAGLGLGAGSRRSALASAFAASLELAREGRAALRQPTLFGPLEIRGLAGAVAAA